MSRPRWFVATFPLLIVGLTGCGSGATSTNTGITARAKEDPWPKAANALRRETDVATCRRVIGQLNADLSANEAAEQPPALNAESEAALRKVVPLTDNDVSELRARSYTPLDAAYLADCYYLADAARTLELDGLSPGKQAEIAFAWVCRQVELRAWVSPAGQGSVVQNPPVPPTYVLRRGWGTGLERAFVFLALLQQIGLDGCLIGPADAGDKGGLYRPPGLAQSAAAPGPFWAVGVRDGTAVRLFDPWGGEPIPGPGGKGIATLTEIAANPAVFQSWFEDKARPVAVTPDAAKASAAWLVAPLSALPPRMEFLEKKLTADAPVRLSLDPFALVKRFKTQAKLSTVGFWNPPGDALSYTRGLATFLPSDEGGKDTRPLGQRLYDAFQRDQLPLAAMALPPAIRAVPEAADHLRIMAANTYVAVFLTAPVPRERLQRGQFGEATAALVKVKDQFDSAHTRSRAVRNQEDAMKSWLQKADAVYAKSRAAQLDKQLDPGAASDAEDAVKQFWAADSDGGVVRTLLETAVAEPGSAEATYLIALGKHEEARRAQARLDRTSPGGESPDPALAARYQTPAKQAWADAKEWWRLYALRATAQERTHPGRADHAKRLAEQADRAGR